MDMNQMMNFNMQSQNMMMGGAMPGNPAPVAYNNQMKPMM